MEPKFYSLDGITCQIGSKPVRGGYAESGEGILLKKVAPVTDTVEGMGGEIAVSANPSKLFDLSVRLLQTSAMNEIFDDMLQGTRDGRVAFKTLYVNDRNGQSIASGTCWIDQPAESAYALKAGMREWKLKAALTKYVVRGNNDVVVDS